MICKETAKTVDPDTDFYYQQNLQIIRLQDGLYIVTKWGFH